MNGDPEIRDPQDWDEALAQASRDLHKEWDSPHLWPKIREALEAEQDRSKAWVSFLMTAWRPAFTMAAVVLAIAGAFWWQTSQSGFSGKKTPAVASGPSRDFLTEQALRETEQAEQAYLRSIDRLQQLAEPDLRKANSPLMASYKEELRLIDTAIEETRTNIEENPFHAHLRFSLAKLYQEKQQTLQEVLTNASN